MRLATRDRRALVLLGVGLVTVVVLRFGVYADRQPAVVNAQNSIPLAEKRLVRLREIAATLPGKQAILANLKAEAALREKGMMQAPTAQQAQAHLLETIRRVGKREGIEVRGGEFPELRVLGEGYGEASVSVNFDCRIEQLVNFLAALTKEPELLATNEIRIASGSKPKEKTVEVRLTLAGVVPRSLVPVKKGLAAL
ncbi:MAG TPA: type II secretion system protein GspM [Bryobacteraceae bacterium]|nr:type II secretion system protein GspM [Bryobacteraceae bacterium]